MILILLALWQIGQAQQSFLQQDALPSNNVILERSKASYDFFIYEAVAEELNELIDTSETKGSSGPANDFMLQQYQRVINRIYEKYVQRETEESQSSRGGESDDRFIQIAEEQYRVIGGR